MDLSLTWLFTFGFAVNVTDYYIKDTKCTPNEAQIAVMTECAKEVGNSRTKMEQVHVDEHMRHSFFECVSHRLNLVVNDEFNMDEALKIIGNMTAKPEIKTALTASMKECASKFDKGHHNEITDCINEGSKAICKD